MIYSFEDFELDDSKRELRRAGVVLSVEPQVFEVLLYLLQHRDRVVSKDELLENVWRTRFVTESALTSRIKAGRRALLDSGRDQRMIRTLHGRGYRFLAPVEERPSDGAVRRTSARPGAVTEVDQRPLVVGREEEVQFLFRRLGDALAGSRRSVVVTGEAGLGKSTLIETFIDQALQRQEAIVARGQSLEQQGVREPYMPVFDVLSRLCRAEPENTRVLSRHAPTWLLEMPWLIDESKLQELRDRTVGSTRSRMLRELTEAVGVIAQHQPLILLIEDIQWSDPSTLDALNALSSSSDPARLLIVSSCRSSAFNEPGHPAGLVMHGLCLRGVCEELRLAPLTAPEVDEYLSARLDRDVAGDGIGQLIHERSGGNPLYVKALTDDWLTDLGSREGEHERVLEEWSRRIPTSLALMIEQRLDSLDARRQRVLEGAAVAGLEFTAGSIAIAIDEPVDEIESDCWQLARSGRFLRAVEEEELVGSTSSRYAFVHSIYQEAIYSRLPFLQRIRLHGGIGRGLEVEYGQGANDHAGELAWHFCKAREASEAVLYSQIAALQALRRFAYQEATEHARAGLSLVDEVPEPQNRMFRIDLLDVLAIGLIPQRGWSDPEIAGSLENARELSGKVEDLSRRSRILYHLAVIYENQGHYERSQELLERRLKLDVPAEETTPLLESHELLACSLFNQGKFEVSLGHADAGWRIYDPLLHNDLLAASVGENLGIGCRCWAALDVWYLGYPDRAVGYIEEAFEVASDPASSYCLSAVHQYAAILYQLRREPDKVLKHATLAMDMARLQGYEFRFATSNILKGWARTELGEWDDGLAELRAGLAAHTSSGARNSFPYFIGLLAEALMATKNPSESLEAAIEARRAITTRGFCYRAELLRIEGMARIELGDEDQGRANLDQALEVARAQGARSLELRIVASAGG